MSDAHARRAGGMSGLGRGRSLALTAVFFVVLIVFLALILVVLSLISMWKENRFGWPLRAS